MFPIANLIPTHNTLRSMDSFEYFRNLFANEDVDNAWKRDKPISIFKTPDNCYYLWDGHHTVAAAYDSGCLYIPEGAFVVRERKYEECMSINFDVGYVTPFDMRKECRIADFIDFKNKIIDLYSSGWKMPYPETFYYALKLDIKGNKHLYSEKRRVNNIEDLINETRLLTVQG